MLAAALMTLGSCAGAHLENASPSPDMLGQEIVAALAAKDIERLRRLAVDEREFERMVWPSLPAARPERNLPMSYVWGDLHQKSDASLRKILAEYGARNLELKRLELNGTATDYKRFRVHPDVRFVIRDPSGKEDTVALCGSLIEADGVWKAFSYVVDE